MPEYTAHNFSWLNNGNWNGLLKGPEEGESTFTVANQFGNTILVQQSSGRIKPGYAFFKDSRSYSIATVDNEDHPSVLTVSPTNSPFAPRDKVICISTKPRVQDQVTLQKTLESVLHQIGGYTYLTQWLAASTVNMRQATGIMPSRFFYPNRHRTVIGYLSFIAQVLRAYNSFPQVVMGFDGEGHFVPGSINYNALQLWQWVDKKRAKIISVDRTAHTMKTIPVMQMPCKAIMNAEIFGIAKYISGQTFQVALDLNRQHRTGSTIRFYTPTESMDQWTEPSSIEVEGYNHEAKPLTQKAVGTFLSYNYVKPIEAIVSLHNMNYMQLQWSSDEIKVDDYFHVQGETTIYEIKSNDALGIFFYPPRTTIIPAGTKIEIAKSTVDLASGILTPAYGDWFISMLHPSNLTANMSFAITGRTEEYDLTYGQGSNTGWYPHDIFGTGYATNYLYKVEDWCYNDLMMPRTYEHMLELLYEFKRLITIMWERLQIINLYLLNDTNNWIKSAYDSLQADPYWRLFI